MVDVVLDPTAVLVFMDSLVHSVKEVRRENRTSLWRSLSCCKCVIFYHPLKKSSNEIIFSFFFDYVYNLHGQILRYS